MSEAKIEEAVDLRAHAQLRRRTVSPNRRRSLPPQTRHQKQQQQGNSSAASKTDGRATKYPTDPIKDRIRTKIIQEEELGISKRMENKPSPPPKLANPPQAPYKKTFIAMLMGGNKDSKKRRSVECGGSSSSDSPPGTPTTPQSPIGRSTSLRSPSTPPPKLLPRQIHPPTPPPVEPRVYRPSSIEGDGKGIHMTNRERFERGMELQAKLGNARTKYGPGSGTNPVVKCVPIQQQRPVFHYPPYSSSNHIRNKAPTYLGGSQQPSIQRMPPHPSQSSVQQSIQNFQTLQRAGLIQSYTRSNTQVNMRLGSSSSNSTSMIGSGASLPRGGGTKNRKCQEPVVGTVIDEVPQFDSVEPLSAHAYPTMSHALVYTHPNQSPQHAIVINPAFLSPHS